MSLIQKKKSIKLLNDLDDSEIKSVSSFNNLNDSTSFLYLYSDSVFLRLKISCSTHVIINIVYCLNYL